MAVGQLAARAATGNFGFITEGLHNAGDALSFEAKRRAMKDSVRAKALRWGAAGIMTAGGIAGVVGGNHNAHNHHNENAEPIALGIALAGASINTAIARRTHGAETHVHSAGHSKGAHEDTKLHALFDATTGWIYVGGLLLEHSYPGSANYAVMANGALTLAGAGITFKDITTTKS